MNRETLKTFIEELERMFPNKLPQFSDLAEGGLLETARRIGHHEVIQMIWSKYWDLVHKGAQDKDGGVAEVSIPQ